MRTAVETRSTSYDSAWAPMVGAWIWERHSVASRFNTLSICRSDVCRTPVRRWSRPTQRTNERLSDWLENYPFYY